MKSPNSTKNELSKTLAGHPQSTYYLSAPAAKRLRAGSKPSELQTTYLAFRRAEGMGDPTMVDEGWTDLRTAAALIGAVDVLNVMDAVELARRRHYDDLLASGLEALGREIHRTTVTGDEEA